MKKIKRPPNTMAALRNTPPALLGLSKAMTAPGTNPNTFYILADMTEPDAQPVRTVIAKCQTERIALAIADAINISASLQ